MDKKFLRLLLVAGMVTALTHTDAMAGGGKPLVATCPNPSDLMIDGNKWELLGNSFARAEIVDNHLWCKQRLEGYGGFINLIMPIPAGYDVTTCSFEKEITGRPVKQCQSTSPEGCSIYCERK
jgi:hypothetical protein